MRRQLIARKLVRGITPAEIAQELDVPLHTIYNDMRTIRSGKFHALSVFTRDRMVCQLYLNTIARKRQIWRFIEEEDLSPREIAVLLREDRLNDEMILNKLPAPRKAPADSEGWGDETDRVKAMSVVFKYEQYYKELKKNEKYKNLAPPRFDEDEKEFLATLGVEKYKRENEGRQPPAVFIKANGALEEMAAQADRRFFEEFDC
jgi:hypothetical protein